ncbi:MAG: GAF domain-containing protein [Hylemonella sp.]|uniref:GAF domain-containing protein n=1 Tax=Hylemonella sp. TaxID=2066020 RepID=UPI0022CCCDC8|nr:GAF domain-containing protein [Hylemonella sp.]MCZ8252811.1 GAF domain-containing protein [Hylemonella sp.]
MIPAPIPVDDAERLAALRQLLILDTPPEQRFDRIAEFATREFDQPRGTITLVDTDRLWFKARVGVEPCEADRATSFCGHAVTSHDFLVVEDARKDQRFHDNPWVLAEDPIVFYAGAPLVLPSGHVAGTLCIYGPQPRGFDAIDRAILGTLRDLCVEELLARQRGEPARA